MIRTLLLGMVLCLAQFAVGSEADTLRDSTQKPVFKALPTAYYTPETRIALEAFAYLSFYTKGAERASNARLFAAVTQNRQLTIDLPWQVFTSGERQRIAGKLDFRKFPEYYYGIGNDTDESHRELYEYSSVGLINKAHFRLHGYNFLGLATEGRWLNAAVPTDAFPQEGRHNSITGFQGYAFAGVGPSFVHDSRDVILCPTNGKFLELTATFNQGATGKQRFAYFKSVADYRQYFHLPKKLVIAYQLAAQATVGNVPYRELPALGGPLMHRGYYFGRFRDKHFTFAQVELRKHLFWRLGAVCFGSVGRVYKGFDDQLFTGHHPAAGGGLRFKLSKKDEANIRFDVSITPDSKGFYVYFAEAF